MSIVQSLLILFTETKFVYKMRHVIKYTRIIRNYTTPIYEMRYLWPLLNLYFILQFMRGRIRSYKFDQENTTSSRILYFNFVVYNVKYILNAHERMSGDIV